MRSGFAFACIAALCLALVIALLAATDYGDAVEVCFQHRVIWVGEERVHCGVVGWRDLP
jgi:hypothetical protein